MFQPFICFVSPESHLFCVPRIPESPNPVSPESPFPRSHLFLQEPEPHLVPRIVEAIQRSFG
jgi:hypothetical protein